MEGSREVLRFLLRRYWFRLQGKLPASEGKTMTTQREKARKICFSLPPDLGVRLRGTPLRGECAGILKEVCGGRCWAFRGGGRQKGETPSHSLWRQVGEDERAETPPGLGWFGVKGRIHLVTGGAEEEEGCLGLEKETAVGTRRGSHLWHFLWPKAGVSAFPTGRLHTELLPQLPGQHRRPRSEQETESAGKAVRGLEGRAWHLSGRVES